MVGVFEVKHFFRNFIDGLEVDLLRDFIVQVNSHQYLLSLHLYPLVLRDLLDHLLVSPVIKWQTQVSHEVSLIFLPVLIVQHLVDHAVGQELQDTALHLPPFAQEDNLEELLFVYEQSQLVDQEKYLENFEPRHHLHGRPSRSHQPHEVVQVENVVGVKADLEMRLKCPAEIVVLGLLAHFLLRIQDLFLGWILGERSNSHLFGVVNHLRGLWH